MKKFKWEHLFDNGSPGTQTCAKCGALIGDEQAHIDWHNAIGDLILGAYAK